MENEIRATASAAAPGFTLAFTVITREAAAAAGASAATAAAAAAAAAAVAS